MIEIVDCQQGSPEWFLARLGLPTASEFASVMAKVGPRGGTSSREYTGRVTYMRKLAGEIITGEPMDSYQNADMERGKEREAEARDRYAFLTDTDPQQVGFIRNGNCGCSPDSLLGIEGTLEIKDAKPHVQIERLQAGTLPSEHKAQVHGVLMVTDRAWCDFISHSRGLPLLVIRVFRDELYIAEIRESVDRFVDELDLMVHWVRAME